MEGDAEHRRRGSAALSKANKCTKGEIKTIACKLGKEREIRS